MTRKWLFAIGAGMAAMIGGSPAMAQDCAALTGMALEDGKIVSAEAVEPGGFSPPGGAMGVPGVDPGAYRALPAFCRVQAVFAPTSQSDIEVEIWLPATGWNGKFVGIGNGVWAGQISYSQLGEPLSRGYAVASTDTGHKGNPLSAQWAVGKPEKLVDFGHRAVHLMTVGAKQAIAAYYGKAPQLSLWNSCSTGGRQGLMEAYRYPQDYDAISAMAPANPMTDLMTQSMWAGYQSRRSPDAGLSMPQMGLLHAAVLKQCDGLDGLEDGVISHPRSCRFDPAILQCKAEGESDCLSAAQVATMRAIYQGVRDPRSGEIVSPGFPYGSEMQLAMLMAGPEPFGAATSYLRDLVFADRQNWDWRSYDYGADRLAARAYGREILDIPADGLGAFFARGGKLLLSHGWNDGLIPAGNTLAFHSTLHDALPAETAQAQLRLFMAPGMEHCAGGEGPNSFDTLGAIDEWATTGEAPERIVATRLPSPMPGAPQLPPMSRPLCAYPLVAAYKGEGDPMVAENFTCERKPD